MKDTKKKRRMRLPNGIGSVHKIGDGKNRRNPWRARVPDRLEFDEASGKCIQKYITLGYYETEKEAIAALFDYQKNPYTAEASTITFSQVFDLWKAQAYPRLSKATQYSYNAAYKSSASLHEMKMREIRAVHMERIMAETPLKLASQRNLKVLWGLLFKYASEHDIVSKNYAEFVKVRDKDEGTTRTAITPQDRASIWNAADAGSFSAKLALIYIYTGFRATELLEVKKTDVDLSSRIITGGKKTAYGKGRHVPIHPSVFPFVQDLMSAPGDYLVTLNGHGVSSPMNYRWFTTSVWSPFIQSLSLDYTTHYCRHTCATMMKEAGIDEDIRKLILGHSTGDVTQRYTHISDKMLLEAICQIPERS